MEDPTRVREDLDFLSANFMLLAQASPYGGENVGQACKN